MAKELTDAVPLDDEPVVAAGKEATDTNDDAGDAGDETVAEVEDEADPELASLTEDDLAAILGSDAQEAIPRGRFNEVAAQREEARREANELRAILAAAVNSRTAAPAAPENKPRDLDAELKAAKAKYTDGSMDLDAYLDLRDQIAEEKSSTRIKAIEEGIQKERYQTIVEKQNAALAQEAAKTFEKYPFLNPKDDDFNNEAATKVVQERDMLVNAGMAPAEALRRAVRFIAPDYGEAVSARVVEKTPDDLAELRRQAAIKKAAQASGKIPPVVSGTANRSTQGKLPVTGSVKDADRIAKLPESEREKLFEAI